MTPSITAQPEPAAYTYGQTAQALSVTASVQQEGGELTYQWYKDGAKIENATGATYIPSLDEYGTASYYCVVTNTYNGRAYTTTSNAADITYSKADQDELRLTNSDTVTYGDTLTLTTDGGTGDGAVTYEIVEGVENAVLSYDNVLTPTKAGTVTVKATKAADDNYNAAAAQQTVTINPADLTLNGSASYDVSAYTTKKPVVLTVPTVTAKNDQTVTSTWAVTTGENKITLENGIVAAADSAEAGDTATVTLTYSADNHNDKVITYHITIQDKNNVSAQITFSAKDGVGTVTYDGTAKSVDTFVNAAAIDEGYTGTITYTVQDSDGNTVADGADLSALRVTNAGTYTVTAAYSDDENEGTKTLEFTVDKATIDVRDWTWDYSALTYNGEAQSVSLADSDEKVGVTYEGNSATDAGSYTAVANLTVKEVYQQNYKISSETLTLNWVISLKSIDVSGVTFTQSDISYDGAPHTVTVSSLPANVTVDYSGDVTKTNAGSYNATATLSPASANYELTGDATLTLTWTISKAAAPTLTAQTVSLRYSNTNAQTFTADAIKTLLGDTNADTTVTISGVTTDINDILVTPTYTAANVTYALKSGLTADKAGETAAITVSFSSNNYENGTVELTVTVIDKNDVSDKITFENGSGVYTGAAQTYETAAVTDSALTGTITYTQSDMTNAGAYTVTATYEDDDNYGQKTVTYTINKAQLTVNGGTVAEKTYDGSAGATVTEVTFDGLVNDETLAVEDYTVSDAAFEDANVGTGKSVGFTVELNATATAQNYVLTSDFGSATGTINPLEVTVTVGNIDAQTYTGSALEPAVTVDADSTVDGYVLIPDTDYTVSYSDNTDAGTASVTVSPADGSNYTFDSVDTTFTINKADPAVTADSLTVPYTGEAIPADQISGTAQFNDLDISGVWSWVTVPGGTDVSETPYAASVKFTPENSNLNESAELQITVTIIKATPTGEPAYTALNTSGKTLADVNLAIGTITPDGGTIQWVDEESNELPGDTAVEANKAYTWAYTPADTDNYNVLTGTIIPYVYIPYVPGPTSYAITVSESENGTISLSASSAASGATVTITAAPDEGYQVESIEVLDAKENLISVTDNGDGTYSFVMPAAKVSVSAVFTEIEQEPVASAELPFTDVVEEDWYADAVRYVYESGLMNGTSDTTFEPEVTTSRGMLVTILYRLEGEPAVGQADFTDVADGEWYADAVAWAAANNIVNGYGDGTFGPNDPITREQLATILYRYAAYKGYDVTVQADLSDYTDAGQISVYALEAMHWANAAELITGVTTTTLVPLGESSRAVMATILMRFIENLAK